METNLALRRITYLGNESHPSSCTTATISTSFQGISIKSPKSLAIQAGVVIKIARYTGKHNNITITKCTLTSNMDFMSSNI